MKLPDNIEDLSIGCIDYGNNNFYEVMRLDDGTLLFGSHNDPGVYDSIAQFFSEIPEEHLVEVVMDLADLLKPDNIN
jgi:hypothetical protein